MKHRTAVLVKEARALRGIKQAVLAHKLDKNVNTIAGWEQGRHGVSSEDLARLAETLEVAIEYRPDSTGGWSWAIHELDTSQPYVDNESLPDFGGNSQ
jgi:transcriptional regulator with XRE-family HTH domain